MNHKEAEENIETVEIILELSTLYSVNSYDFRKLLIDKINSKGYTNYDVQDYEITATPNKKVIILVNIIDKK